MTDYKYKISVVIPVYNCEEFIGKCVDSLMKQTMPQNSFQIVFVNDGSPDNSGGICRSLAEKYDNIVVFEQENSGVSAARNKGMELADGKYIIFLDADDELSENTLKSLYEFFEEHYDETDLVTYKIIPYYGKKRYALHYRYRILRESGIFDLNDEENCHITQTTMNICIKNPKGGRKVSFDTSLAYHEDQKFCFDVVQDKMTIGYCGDAEYLYLRNPASVTQNKCYAYYIFEDTMAMWEELFGRYENEVPAYLQSLYINDLNWKSRSDVLLPYHYGEEEFDRAVDRIVALLRRVDDKLILERPVTDLYHKHFLLRLKGCDRISLECADDGLKLLYDNDEVVYETAEVGAVVKRMSVADGKLSFDAFLKSPVFMYCEKPEVILRCNGKEIPVELTKSVYEYYRAKIRTATFWRVRFDVDISEDTEFSLCVRINGKEYGVSYYYGLCLPFVQTKKLKVFYKDGKCFREDSGVFSVTRVNSLKSRLFRLRVILYNFFYYLKINPGIIYNRMVGAHAARSDERIWLYLDRYGLFDNAYDQFKHDIQIDDGVKRYYVINECDLDSVDEKFTPEERAHLIVFRSRNHKKLYFAAEKIITSFSNLSNVSPFDSGPMRWYSDLTKFEIVYLQHGILHADLKELYAKELCLIDKVVVSSGFEVENFVKNYGYDEKDLIKCGMPRYDFFRTDAEKKNRIVFSPSWRGNLIGPLRDNSREEKPEAFVESDFYKAVSEFLNSERLERLLEKYDLYLDFKNHPIFKCYNSLFNITNKRVCIDGFDTKQDEYRLMITDYSSIVFDSVYMNCPIIYFVPDYDKFKAGISHSYRRLDLPLEKGFGPFTQTADELLDSLEEYAANNFEPVEPYKSRMENFFLHKDTDCRKRLYDAIK